MEADSSPTGRNHEPDKARDSEAGFEATTRKERRRAVGRRGLGAIMTVADGIRRVGRAIRTGGASEATDAERRVIDEVSAKYDSKPSPHTEIRLYTTFTSVLDIEILPLTDEMIEDALGVKMSELGDDWQREPPTK